MRNVRAEDMWNKIPKYDYKSYVDTLDMKNHNGLKVISFGKGIQIVCGLNGVGKSTVMIGIKNILGLPLRKAEQIKLGNKKIEGIVWYDGIRYECDSCEKRLLNQVECEDSLGYIEYSDVSRIVETIWKQDNFDELLEQSEFAELDNADVKEINYLVGRNYDEISVTEIEDLETLGTFPYFRVKEGNVEYDTIKMGTGEYCLLYIYWYIKKQKKKSIILIEEPESFIGIRSQKFLMNFFAQESVNKGCSFIISTHSPYVLENIHNENISIISRMSGNALIKKPTAMSAHAILGGDDELKGTFLVEDELAKSFLELFLERENVRAFKHFDIVVANSASDISNILNKKVLKSINHKIVGVYDGDQKKEQLNNIVLKYLFLPLEKDVEYDMKQLLSSDNTYIEVAEKIGKKQEDFFELLSNISGLDHHDWWDSLCDNLAINEKALLIMLYDIWRSHNTDKVENAIKEFEDCMKD